MIWNDEKIYEWAKNGGVEPFDETCINPNSIDLKIGNYYRYPTDQRWSEKIETNDNVVIIPNGLVMCHTLEFTKIPKNAVAILYLKSSIARIGIEHLHSGFGDAGFHGEWTLIFSNMWYNYRYLKVGSRVCQLVIHDCLEPKNDYSKKGHYQNQTGPVISHAD